MLPTEMYQRGKPLCGWSFEGLCDALPQCTVLVFSLLAFEREDVSMCSFFVALHQGCRSKQECNSCKHLCWNMAGWCGSIVHVP